ncbi:MAG: universal stress protein [Candidatus Saliniplasma sp.]
MESYKKILIPTDGSEANSVAVEKGLSLARLLGAKAKILFVVDTSTFIDLPPDDLVTNITSHMKNKGEDVLDNIEEKAEEFGVSIERSVKEGHPAEIIIQESKDVDIIVIGTHGRSGFSRLLLGSTAEKVIRHAECPVMVMKIKEDE